MFLFLLLLGSILIIFNVRFIKDKGISVKETTVEDKNIKSRNTEKNETAFSKALEKEEINITDVEVIIGKLRIEFSETILELQKEIVELKDRLEDTNDKVDSFIEASTVSVKEEKITSQVIENKNENNISLDNIDFKQASSRTNEIGELLKKGFSVEEVSEKLQIGRGEILLIEKLYQK